MLKGLYFFSKIYKMAFLLPLFGELAVEAVAAGIEAVAGASAEAAVAEGAEVAIGAGEIAEAAAPVAEVVVEADEALETGMTWSEYLHDMGSGIYSELENIVARVGDQFPWMEEELASINEEGKK